MLGDEGTGLHARLDLQALAGLLADHCLAVIEVDPAWHAQFINDPAAPDCQWSPGTCGTAPIVDLGAYEFIPGDYDRNDDLDLADLTVLQARVSGPAVAHANGCAKTGPAPPRPALTALRARCCPFRVGARPFLTAPRGWRVAIARGC